MFTKDNVTAALDLYFDDFQIKGVEDISAGQENIILLVTLDSGQIVLRFWGDEHSHFGQRKDTDIQYELELMNLFYEHELPIPKIHVSKNKNRFEKITIEKKDRPFAILEYVEGKEVENVNETMVRQVAKTMAKMHLIAPQFSFPVKRSWPGTIIELTKKEIGDVKKIEHEIQRVFGEKVVSILNQTIKEFEQRVSEKDFNELPRGPIHGDIHLENMKFEKEKLIGIFDFDDCRDSYFIEDIVKTIMFRFGMKTGSFFGEDGKNVQVFVKEYEKVRKLKDIERENLSLFYQVRFLYELLSNIRKFIAGGEESYKQRALAAVSHYDVHKEFFSN